MLAGGADFSGAAGQRLLFRWHCNFFETEHDFGSPQN
jgi:hypothetical protein